MRILLAGNPNCGKSTLFNTITDSQSPVGNFSGVTVKVYQGKAKRKFAAFEAVVRDLPGMYSLEATTPDEVVAETELRTGAYDCIVNVVDGTALNRQLGLTRQLLTLGKPVVVAVNMADVLKKRGVNIDYEELSESFGGVAAVPVSAKSGEGLCELFDAVSRAEAVNYAQLPDKGYLPQENAAENNGNTLPRRDYMPDKIFLHRIIGPIVSLIFFAAIFLLTFGTAGRAASESLGYLISFLTERVDIFLIGHGVAPALRSLVCDGILSGVLGVLSFCPQLVILYGAVAVLEDSGIMARFAFVTDGFFRKLGLSGKAAVPLIMSFGCSVPALSAARTSDTPKGRLVTLCIIPFISCSARLPIYFYIIGKFFSGAELPIILLLYIFGIAAGLSVGRLVSGGEEKGELPFLIELPPYRVPALRSVFAKIRLQLRHFICKAATVILLASVAMWILQHFSPSLLYIGDNTHKSILYSAGSIIAPLFKPLGFGFSEVTIALITGIAAKEAVVSSLTVFEAGGFALASVMSRAGACSLLCFSAMYTPCIAAIATLKKELGNGKKTAALLAIQFVIAYITAGFVYLVFSAVF